MPDASALIDEFEGVLDSVYGLYLDSTMGFSIALRFVENAQRDAIAVLRSKSPELANLEYLDSVAFTFGRGDPGTSEAVELHQVSQGEFKERMRKAGRNYREIANLCLVSIYQYWEDHYRADIASALGRAKNELASDVFGDLRHLRRSILHNRAIALPEVGSNRVLAWFHPGDRIHIDEQMFEDLIDAVKRALSEIRRLTKA